VARPRRRVRYHRDSTLSTLQNSTRIPSPSAPGCVATDGALLRQTRRRPRSAAASSDGCRPGRRGRGRRSDAYVVRPRCLPLPASGREGRPHELAPPQCSILPSYSDASPVPSRERKLGGGGASRVRRRPVTSPLASSAACGARAACVPGRKRVGPSARVTGCSAMKVVCSRPGPGTKSVSACTICAPG
jgi:hypothetical protein